MNSSKLIKQYRRLYDNFYLEHSLVISAPLLFDRTGSNDNSSVSIKQKLPLRVYVGLQTQQEP